MQVRTVKKAPPKQRDGVSKVQSDIINTTITTQGSHVVCSVAGSGKTRLIVYLIKYLIGEGVSPRSILATTFTKKAANEMNERLEKLCVDTDECRVGTFHSVCYEILRKDGKAYGGRYKIIEEGKATFGLKDIVGYKGMNWPCDITGVMNFISLAKNHLLRPDEIPVECNAPDEYKGLTAPSREHLLAYEMFEDWRNRMGYLTFDDMLIRCWELLSECPQVLRNWQDKYKHLIVDEFQDTNVAQYEIMRLLAYPENNIVVVGDDDQSIYAWRGAKPQYIQDFAKEFNAVEHYMEMNYRSVPEILRFANNIVVNNQVRLPKCNIPHREESGVKPLFRAAENSDDEAVIVADTIEECLGTGYTYNDIAVLYRTNAQSRACEEEFIKRQIPHIVLGGVQFYNRKEVKDLMAYVRVASGNDPDLDWVKRIVNTPMRYIGKATIDKASKLFYRGGYSTLLDAIIDADGVWAKQRSAVIQLKKTLSKVKSAIDLGNRLPDIFQLIIEEIDYENYIIKEEGQDTADNSRIANIRELVRTTDRFQTIDQLLTYVDGLLIKHSKGNADSKQGNRVVLMTGHRAKGLEFPVVFGIGWAEKILPHARAEDIEEERRLAYVIATRAEDLLYISYPKTVYCGDGNGRLLSPSRFIDEGGEDIEFQL